MIPPLRYILSALTLGSLLVLSVYATSIRADSRLSRLDTLVTLTAEQKVQAAEIFQIENTRLDGFSPEDRLSQGTEARQKSRQQIRALLTPAQRNKFDLSPQTLGGGLRFNPDSFLTLFDQLLGLSAEQKQNARSIMWSELADQLAAVPEGGELKGFFWREATRDQLRALLTPEQLQKYNRTPQMQGGARTGAIRKSD